MFPYLVTHESNPFILQDLISGDYRYNKSNLTEFEQIEYPQMD